jgi:hypothetical protein
MDVPSMLSVVSTLLGPPQAAEVIGGCC